MLRIIICQMNLSNLSVNKSSSIFRILSSNMSSKKKNKQSTQKTEDAPVSKSPINIDKLGNIKINILAKPGAKQNGITDIGEEEVGVQIAAPPVDGEANQELIKYLSKLLGLRKSDLDLDKGSKSRQKIVLIQKNVITIEQIMATLNNEIDTN